MKTLVGSMQAIKYKWLMGRDAAEPYLIVQNNGETERLQLLGNRLFMTIGEKTCIGYYHDGKSFACAQERVLEHGWSCNECKMNDDFALCMQCNGSECINMKQREECSELIYYIYLAAFSNILKVGISMERRIMERLVEQGADLGALIALVKDGKEVRLVEQQIARKLNITDRIRGAQKHDLIFGNPNIAAANILNALKKLGENGFSRYMIKPEIYDLRPYYRLHNVFSDPQRIVVSNGCTIKGTPVAAKGNIIILQDNGGFYSLNSHDLIGRKMVCEDVCRTVKG